VSSRLGGNPFRLVRVRDVSASDGRRSLPALGWLTCKEGGQSKERSLSRNSGKPAIAGNLALGWHYLRPAGLNAQLP